MSEALSIVKFLHILSFVFMSIPLFNLIVVNERAMMAGGFVYATDRYMENIIRRGAARCYVFQGSVLITGILLIAWGPLPIQAIWQNAVMLGKTLVLFVLMGLLSYVHLGLQPRIEALLAGVTGESPPAENLAALLKPHRVRRKRVATLCLFLVIMAIILGVQVYVPFRPMVNLGLTALAALFAGRANRTLLRFGWV